ncbi:MAG: helix-turn-helix domain-containing protein [Ideonella sp.]|nr:helix-turn-helix domain-containing protein [Ideonella sp.]
MPGCAGAAAPRELHGEQVACRQCSLFALCLPVGVGPADLDLLERVIKRRRMVARGEPLFRRGERLHSVFAVKSGSVKTTLAIGRKRVQVTGFHFPGELIALDAVGAGSYQYDACALEASSLCEVPFDKLEELGMAVHSLQRQLLRVMSGQIRHDLLQQVLHCRMTAEERLAGFLVNLSARFEQRGFSATEFRLPMPREDIANYLGLAKETVCRLFTSLQQRGLLHTAQRQLQIRDRGELEAIAGLQAGDFVAPAPRTYPRSR